MKRPPLRSRLSKKSGFTLIELLVVMAIISILAAILFEVGSGVINSAKRTKAKALAVDIEAAVKQYYGEYGYYPVPAGTAQTDFEITDTDQTGWQNLLVALCGNIDPSTGVAATSTVPNPKGIPFLSLRKGDVDPNHKGTITQLNPLPPDNNTLFFNIAIDNDYDNILGTGNSSVQLPDIDNAAPSTDPNKSGGTASGGVAVWANCNGNTTTKNPSFWIRTY